MNAIQVLLRHSIDYAGLFPPAGLDMKPAVDNYAQYLTDPHSWALGRFVLPAGRLPEFEAAAASHLSRSPARPWQLSALLGAELEPDLAAVNDFNRKQQSGRAVAAVIDSVELKADSTRAIDAAMDLIPPQLQAYIEIPAAGDPAGLIGKVARAGHRPKVRTGGITAEAFPASSELLRFISACIRHRTPFKATAGLHHPLRAEYRLTYDRNGPRGVMFGFLNLFLATGFLQAGMEEIQAQRVLEDGSRDGFLVDEDAIAWQGWRLALAELRRIRAEGLTSFGSCSFTEPIQDLQELQLLDGRVPQT
jgi:hypothetical protein